jgi:hypothetical protein
MSKVIPTLSGGSTGIPIYPSKADFPIPKPNGYKVMASDTGITYTFSATAYKYVIDFGPPIALEIQIPNNGLSLSGPSLAMSLASDSNTGALSASDHRTYTNYGTDIAANTASIVTNTANIATNTTDISTNTTAIATKAPLASPVFTGDVNSSTGNILISNVGSTLNVKSGANSKIGIITLVNGIATVSNTSVTSNSVILISSQSDGVTRSTPGYMRITSVTPGTGFVIQSSNGSDDSVVGWFIVEMI